MKALKYFGKCEESFTRGGDYTPGVASMAGTEYGAGHLGGFHGGADIPAEP